MTKSPAKLEISAAVLAALLLAFGPAACSKEEGGGKEVLTKGGTPTATTTQGAATPATSSSSGGYQEMDAVPDAGTIQGTVSYAGDKTAPELKVTKNPETCTHGDQPDGSINVAGGKVKNAIVYLTDVKKGKKWSSDSVEVDNLECIFNPRVSVGKLKGTIVAKNSDPLLHNTNLFLVEEKKQLYNIALPSKGQTSEKKLKREGLIDVKCDVHEWMQAWVYVSPHPYAVVTGEDGTFTMDNVPPGEYTAKVWHEALGEKEMKIKVEAGQTATPDVAL